MCHLINAMEYVMSEKRVESTDVHGYFSFMAMSTEALLLLCMRQIQFGENTQCHTVC